MKVWADFSMQCVIKMSLAKLKAHSGIYRLVLHILDPSVNTKITCFTQEPVEFTLPNSQV